MKGSVTRNRRLMTGVLLFILGLAFAAPDFPAAPGSVYASQVSPEEIRKDTEADRSGFPEDLETRPLSAESIKSGTVDIYTDSDLFEVCGQTRGDTLSLVATRITKEAVYGEYTSGDDSGSGWFSLDTFIEDPDYTKEYATLRKKTNIFKHKDYKGGKVSVKKYSGIILVSKSGDKRQVLYETEEGYGLGWIKPGSYKNILEYDGRPKQILANGAYRLYSGYDLTQNTQIEATQAVTLQFVYVEQGLYYIFDSSGRWLSVNEEDSGLEQEAIWNEEGTPGSRDTFLITRDGSEFVMQHQDTGCYVGRSTGGDLKIYAQEMGDQTRWRVTSEQKKIDVEDPLVFTQYDPQWCANAYGSDGCIGTAGCGVLAVVNAVYSLSGQYMDVMELADYAVEKNYRIVGSGTADGIFKAAAQKYGEKYGFSWDGSSEKISVLVKKLKAGDTAVSHVQGHFVCIAACSEDGKKFLVLDSNRLPFRETTAFGDWVDIKRLQKGALSSSGYFFYKQYDITAQDKDQSDKEGKTDEDKTGAADTAKKN